MHDELEHYGILGMKWGIRRYQPYPPGKHGTFLGQTRDEDIHIKKGTTAYRVQRSDKLREGQTYVSFMKEDNVSYVTAAADDAGVAVYVEGQTDDKVYTCKMKLTRDVIAPSYNKTMESFIRTVDKMGGSKAFAEDTWKNYYDAKKRTKDFVKKYGKTKSQDALDEVYINFAATLMRDTKARQLFFQDLESQGYNAIVDDWDRKFDAKKPYYMTETPTIIFDSSSLKVTNAKPLTQHDYDYFYEINAINSGGGSQEIVDKYFSNKRKEWDKFYGK